MIFKIVGMLNETYGYKSQFLILASKAKNNVFALEAVIMVYYIPQVIDLRL